MSGSGIQTAAGWVWDASWHAAIVAGVVLLIRQIAGRRIGPSLRAALWLLVGARLLMFWTPETNWSLFRVFLLFESSPRTQIPSPTRSVEEAAGPKITIGYGPAQGGLPPDGPAPRSTTVAKESLRGWAALIWLAGAVILLARMLSTSLQLRRLLARSTAITDPRLLRLLGRCQAEMKVSRAVALRSSGGVDGPALAGVWRPAILLPPGLCDALCAEELRFVFLHELAHVRRHDLLIEWLLAVLAALHWFNPVMWLSAALYRADRELCRDDMVLALTGPAHRADYGHTLLRLLELLSPRRQSPRLALTMVGEKRNLKQRISMIAHLRPTPARLTVAAIVLVFGLLAWIVLTNPREQKVSDASSHPTTTPAPSVGPAGRAEVSGPASRVEASGMQVLLERRLPEINFSGQALSDVVDFMRDVSGANIFVDWKALETAGIARSAPVSARMRNVSLAKALDVILADAGANKVKLGFAVEDNVIMISTTEQLAVIDTRVYDIRDLLAVTPDFHSDAAHPINGDQGAARAPAPKTADVLAERKAAVIKLIQETIDPPSWRPPFHAAIKEINGQLIVAQTAGAHEAIRQLLGQLRQARGMQINTLAQFVVFDPENLPADDPKLETVRMAEKRGAADKSKPAILSQAEHDALIKTVTRLSKNSIVVAPRLTTFNGQSAYVKIGSQIAYVSDLNIVRDKLGSLAYQPVLDHVDTGITLDLQGIVSADRKYVTLTLRAKLSRLLKMNSAPFPRVPKDHPAEMEKPMIQVPDMRSAQAALTASVPDGQALLIGLGPDTGLLAPENKPYAPIAGQRMYILVTPTLTPTADAAAPTKHPLLNPK